jgi:Asp-tRNA(Asn)/Glu-tRNA(Gln) amidotransferase A subunit family amidase
MMREMEEVMSQVDLYVGGRDLTLTNLTGHPSVVLPNGLQRRGGVDAPTALTFTGRLFGETELLAVAHAYQRATDFHLPRPPMEKILAEKPGRSATI